MVVGAKVCELTDGFLWFVCCLYVGILRSTLIAMVQISFCGLLHKFQKQFICVSLFLCFCVESRLELIPMNPMNPMSLYNPNYCK